MNPYRRFMFSCQIEGSWYFLEDWMMFHFQQRRSKSQGGKEKSSLMGQLFAAPEVQEFVSHLCSYKNTFLEQRAAKRGFPKGVTHTVCSTNSLSWEKITQRSTDSHLHYQIMKKRLGRFGRVRYKGNQEFLKQHPHDARGGCRLMQHQRQG